MNQKRSFRRLLLPPLVFAGGLLAGATAAVLGLCGPFTDVAADVFCPFVQEVFYLGITTGTTATTYDPTSNVTRLQMAAFLSRSVDVVLKRGSQRAAIGRFWSSKGPDVLGLTTVGGNPYLCACDGADVWVANHASGTVSRVRGSDGKLLETWTGAPGAWGVHVAMGRVFVTGADAARLYAIDPSQPAGAVTIVSTAIGSVPQGVTFDGARVWTANIGGSVSIVTPGASFPWTVTTVTAGFFEPTGAVFDGTRVWVTDGGGKLFKLDAAGAILQTVTAGVDARYPVFDGANIWVPGHGDNTVTVVRASTGAVLQTLTGNGLSLPWASAFDGERVLVASGNDTVSLWKAADLSVIGSVGTGASTTPNGACADGVGFWITLYTVGKLARF
ncbi:MAG TPA: S-layer homology domain-containing protein [Thermoanaerobaculia bacterium]|nr:S-layer homology domain-containing protein [Thermoanaerobaculia bacterium]